MNRLIPIVSIIVLLGVIAVGIFILKPQLDNLMTLKAQLGNLISELKQKQVYYAKISELNLKLDQYKDQVAEIDSALPVDPSAPALYSFFQTTAPANGLVLKDITGGLTATGDRIKDITFKVSLLGSYVGLKNFLNVIYRNSRMFEVDSLTIVPPEKPKGDFGFDLILETHSYNPK